MVFHKLKSTNINGISTKYIVQLLFQIHAFKSCWKKIKNGKGNNYCCRQKNFTAKEIAELTCSDNAILHFNTTGCTDVDAISIGASSRCYHFKIGYCNPQTISKCYVHLLTVDNHKIVNFQILALMESQSLHFICYTVLNLKILGEHNIPRDKLSKKKIYGTNYYFSNKNAGRTVGACRHGCNKRYDPFKDRSEKNTERKIDQKIKYTSTFVFFLLHDLAHHSCPIPLIVPPPSTWRWFTPWKYSHLRGFKPSHTSGSSGATIVPEIY